MNIENMKTFEQTRLLIPIYCITTNTMQNILDENITIITQSTYKIDANKTFEGINK